MSLEVAQRGIDFVLSNALARGLQSFEVFYHGGGEPTVNWDVLTKSLAYAKNKAADAGLKVAAYAATNGVLRDHQIDWIIAELEGASVSLDGSPDVQNEFRPLVNGRGSSTRIERTLRSFEAAGFPYGVRVTVPRDQIRCLPDSIAYICSNFHPRRIQVEPVYLLGRASTAQSADEMEFVEHYRLAQSIARKHHQDLTYSAARLDTLTNHFCGVTRDNFCLTPSGNVSACYESFSEETPWSKVFFYGRQTTGRQGYEFDLGTLERLRRQTVEHRPYCKGCFAKWHCAGDCYHKTLSSNGTRPFAGTDRCEITRELVNDQILERIATSGGLIWHAQSGVEPTISQGDKL